VGRGNAARAALALLTVRLLSACAGDGEEAEDARLRNLDGMDVVDGLFAGYGDGPPRGEGVYQARALAPGAEYFDLEFPELDRIERATIP
jgi:hypothetical protein